MEDHVEILKHFQYAQLPAFLQKVSKPFCDLAYAVARTIPEGEERAAGLRKLLEAKDCVVRAARVGAKIQEEA